MKVNKQTGYVLHSRPYRESSLLVDLFTREFGRLTVLAKGARRLKSSHRGVLQPFTKLLVGWSGKGELPILTQAEALERAIPLKNSRLWCGFYLNELLTRLLHRFEAHSRLFDCYSESLDLLSGANISEPVLRVFEKRLLEELGYALELKTEVETGTPVDPNRYYSYVPTQGLVTCRDNTNKEDFISGGALLALEQEQLSDPGHLRESKLLMRKVINFYLGGKQLHTRRTYSYDNDIT